MNRRQTLAGLSPAQLNSRASFGPSRITKEGKNSKKITALISRQSLATKPAGNPQPTSRLSPLSGVQRRSSTYGKKTTGPKQDPRPVSDKGYQHDCIRQLIEYLSTHGYEHPVSPKTLTSPMSKDVFSIVQFLLKQVDPHMKPLGKMEEDVPQLFKHLKYPFQISKSALFAVGSPHTWPGLLAAMNWVVEILNYAEKAEEARTDVFDDKQRSEHDFFEYVAKSYKYFLAGDDYQSQAVDDEIAQEAEDRAEQVRQRNQQLQQANEELQARLEALRSQPSALLQAQAKQEEHVRDRDKFRTLIDNLQSHKQSLQRKLQERKAEVESKQEQLASTLLESDAMRAVIAGQTVNKDDVVRMNQEKCKQAEILAGVCGQREALERRVYEQDVQLELSLDELETTVQAYNTAADRLQLIPVTAKYAGGLQYEIQLDRAGVSASDIITVDLKGEVKPALARLRDSRAARARELSEEVLAVQERLDGGLEALTERTEDNAALGTQVHKLEASLRGQKEALEVEVRGTAGQADSLREQVGQLRNQASHALAASEDKLRSLHTQYDDLLRNSEAEVQSVNVELGAALEHLFHHKLHIQQTLEQVYQHVEDVHKDVLAMAC
ncbi:hypothetical protein ABBQ32_009992 [Trebouxia sp. C0010 RCD-2024]